MVEVPSTVRNYINGDWILVDDAESLAVINPATGEGLATTPLSPASQVDQAAKAATGKRVQAQGGAKNPMVVLPDADLEAATTIVADSAFGCAGQRCLAASLAITVGESGKTFTEAIGTVARERRVGSGLDAAIEMGPVISAQSRDRIERLIGTGVGEGGRLVADGRQTSIAGYEDGFFIRPTVLADLPAGGELARTEIFGPVLGLIHVETVDEAIGLLNSGNYGNMACLFTRNGAAARQFRYQAEVGNIGINLGVAAPMAHFPFSGWKDSFFGDLHGQGRDAVEFFTQKKVVVERWPDEWTRKF
jgi:malonate-semialdehyde dehydrogenase (acetylating)/methylmalonate-semialdehyde dehydrogenase